MRSFYKKYLLERLQNSVAGSRIHMFFLALLNDFVWYDSAYANSGSKIFTPAEIDGIFAGLDEKSIAEAWEFMRRQTRLAADSLLICSKNFFPEEDQLLWKKIRKEFYRLRARYDLRKAGTESLYFHHGLRNAPQAVKDHIRNRLFVDAGGWLGDSALAFNLYHPGKMLIFEPGCEMRKNLTEKLSSQNISPEQYRLFDCGLSSKNDSSAGFPCMRLDDVQTDGQIGVIKADVEGMGLELLRGAERTIREHRPYLALSIYHNEAEFAGIYQTLKSWNLNYHLEIVHLAPQLPHGEYTLIGYPQEWLLNSTEKAI